MILKHNTVSTPNHEKYILHERFQIYRTVVITFVCTIQSMASYHEFARKIGEGDIVSAYKNVLTEVNYCINLFEDLEAGRTYPEQISDWLAGERAQINIEDFPFALKTLKEEIEHGLELYVNLSIKKKKLELASQGSKLQSVRSADNKTPRWGVKQELMNQFDELLSLIKDVAAPKRMQPQNWLYISIQNLASYYTNLNKGDRAKMYETAKVLYLTLNQNEVLKILKQNHTTVRELISRIDSVILMENSPRQQDSADVQKAYSKEVISERNNLSEKSTRNAPLSEGNDQTCSMEDGVTSQSVQNSQSSAVANARNIYNKTLLEEQKELESSEPEMSCEERVKLATRIAVRDCKKVLVEMLHYSNPEADDIIKNIQS